MNNEWNELPAWKKAALIAFAIALPFIGSIDGIVW